MRKLLFFEFSFLLLVSVYILLINYQLIEAPEILELFHATPFTFLIFGIALILISLNRFLHNSSPTKKTLTLLILGGVFIRIFAILLDNHLNIWDEQFHALVANLMAHPLKLTLLENPVLPYNYQMWIHNHIWLHKQPLFLWQMVLSLKIFVLNLIALRQHPVVMSGILMMVIYRMGKLLVSPKIGFYAVLFFITSNFAIEQASGYLHTDHNDVTFLFYVTLSIWIWLEYSYASSRKRQLLFIILTGLFSGAAVLIKWLIGIIAYTGWGIFTLSNTETRFKLQSYLDIILAFFVTIFIALPWQIYISFKYPKESSYEYELNTKHFVEAIESHSGNWAYHIDKSKFIYGLPFWVITLGIALFLSQIVAKNIRLGILVIFSSVYIFFGLAATKMPAFVFIMSPFVFLGYASLLSSIFLLINNNIRQNNWGNVGGWFKMALVIYLSILFLNFEEIKNTHTSWKKENEKNWQEEQSGNQMVAHLNQSIPYIEKHVLFNLKNLSHIKAIFFTNAVAAYRFIPSEKNLNKVIEQSYSVAIYMMESFQVTFLKIVLFSSLRMRDNILIIRFPQILQTNFYKINLTPRIKYLFRHYH